MSSTERLPLLPLDDAVVLPGHGGARGPGRRRGARRRRRRPAPGRHRAQVLLVPAAGRPLRAARHDRRRRAGRPAARRRARRAWSAASAASGSAPAPPAPARRCGSRRTALADDRAGRARPASWPRSTRRLVDHDPAAARRLAGRRQRAARIDRPVGARRHRRLRRRTSTPTQKLELLETADVGRPAGEADRLGPRAPGRAGRRRDDPQGRPGGHGEAAARVPAAPAAGRGPQGAGRAERRRPAARSRTTAPASRPPTCPRRSARPRSRRSTSWSGPPTSRRRSAGSGPGWTPSSSCRGTSAPRTPTTSPAPARCWTPTTPAWTT